MDKEERNKEVGDMKQITFITMQQNNVVFQGILLDPFEIAMYLRELNGCCTREKMCACALLGRCSKWEIQKSWKTWEYPGPHLYHIPAFSHFSKNHLPPRRLTGPASVYDQHTVTVCRLVTEYRPASEGLWPAWKTTRRLQGDSSRCLESKWEGVSMCACVVTISQTNCTMYANMAH